MFQNQCSNFYKLFFAALFAWLGIFSTSLSAVEISIDLPATHMRTGGVFRNLYTALKAQSQKVRDHVSNTCKHVSALSQKSYTYTKNNKDNIIAASFFATHGIVIIGSITYAILASHHTINDDEYHRFAVVPRSPIDLQASYHHGNALSRHMVTLSDDSTLLSVESAIQQIFPLMIVAITNWFTSLQQSGVSTVMSGTEYFAQSLINTTSMQNLYAVGQILSNSQCPNDQTLEWNQLKNTLSKKPWPGQGRIHFCAMQTNTSNPSAPLRLIGCSILANATSDMQNALVRQGGCYDSELNWGDDEVDIIILRTSSGGLSISYRPPAITQQPAAPQKRSLSPSTSKEHSETLSVEEVPSPTESLYTASHSNQLSGSTMHSESNSADFTYSQSGTEDLSASISESKSLRKKEESDCDCASLIKKVPNRDIFAWRGKGWQRFYCSSTNALCNSKNSTCNSSTPINKRCASCVSNTVGCTTNCAGGWPGTSCTAETP